MLRNNADVRQCSYFELGLPVVTPCKQMRVKMISKNNINLLLLYPFDSLKYSQSPFFRTPHYYRQYYSWGKKPLYLKKIQPA